VHCSSSSLLSPTLGRTPFRRFQPWIPKSLRNLSFFTQNPFGIHLGRRALSPISWWLSWSNHCNYRPLCTRRRCLSWKRNRWQWLRCYLFLWQFDLVFYSRHLRCLWGICVRDKAKFCFVKFCRWSCKAEEWLFVLLQIGRDFGACFSSSKFSLAKKSFYSQCKS